MFRRIRKIFGSGLPGGSNLQGDTPKIEAATQLAEIPAPTKLRKGLRAVPSYLNTATPDRANKIANADRRLATTDMSRVNRTQSTRQIIRELSHGSSDLSAAMNSFLRTAITGGYKAVARNLDGTINADATNLAYQILSRFDYLPDYNEGFGGTTSMLSISESLGKELFMYGAAAIELVLDEGMTPKRLQPISVTSIEFYPDKDGLKPVQTVGGDEVVLDIPTFFYTALDQDLLSAYASSPVESAIQPILFSEQFVADIRRVVRRAVHPRIKVTINEESFRKYAPQEAAHDEEKMQEYYDSIIRDIEEKLNSLEPEEAMVFSDIINVELENNGNISLSSEYKTLEDLTNAKMATGAKVMPSMLGHGSGTSNVASTETLIFMKAAQGMVQNKLNEIYSKALTLAVRLFGLDVIVEFKYNPINLRPDDELEAFKAQKQSRILELLSLGLMSDEEASIELTGHLPPLGYKTLSGTMFKSALPSTDNPYNGETNDGSTVNQSLKPQTPTSGRGQNNKRNNLKEKPNE